MAASDALSGYYATIEQIDEVGAHCWWRCALLNHCAAEHAVLHLPALWFGCRNAVLWL